MITNDFSQISAENELRDLITILPNETENEREILHSFDVDRQAGIDHNFLN